MNDTGRGATINIAQLPNGYWRGEVILRIPGLSDGHFLNDLCHDAGEALDWARLTIQTSVIQVSSL